MANVQIPNLPAAISLNGTEQLEAVQAGTTCRITTAQIATFVTGSPTPFPVSIGGTGANTFTAGYLKADGTNPFTTVATIPNTDITGLGTMSTQNANSVSITGGSINGTSIGATTPSTASFLPGVVISGSSADAALRVTQTGAGDAILVEDSANPDSTPFVVTATGNVGIGVTAPVAPLQILGTTQNRMWLSGAAINSRQLFVRSNGTFAAPTIVASGNDIGSVNFFGYDGAANIELASMAATVDGTPGTNDMPGRLVFSTTADGASSPTERMRIASNGNVTVGGSSLNDLRYLDISNPDTGASAGCILRFISSNAAGSGNVAANIVKYKNGAFVISNTETDAAAHTAFNVGASERLRISNAGVTTITGTGIINANSASEALRITQTGAGNAILVEDSANPDATPFLVDANGIVISGSLTSISGTAGIARFQSNNSLSGFSAHYAGVDASPAVNTFLKSRGGAIVASGDQIGSLRFEGFDGTNYLRAAQISAFVDATPGTNDMPGRLTFSTTADGASDVTERMRIRSDGNIGIGGAGSSNNTFAVTKSLTGAVGYAGINSSGVIQPDVSTIAYYFISSASSASNGGVPYTITNVRHYDASQGTFNADSTIANQQGFHSNSSLIGATNNSGFLAANTAAITAGRTAFGFRSEVNIATGGGLAYGFFAAGTAPNILPNVIGGTGAASVLTLQSTTGVGTTDAILLGTGSQVERVRVDNSGVISLWQPAQTSLAAATTLDAAQVRTRIIQYTGGAATVNLPTGTTLDTVIASGMTVNSAFELTFINTSANLLTIGANGNTTVGTLTVATLTSGTFRFRKTAANTFTVYRVA